MELISLHIRSMWETICDAWACWSGWNFGPNPTEYPYSVVTWYRTPPPPMKIVRESKSECPRIPPPPKSKLPTFFPKSKSEGPRIPPNENCQRVQIQRSQNTPPKWKLSESPNPSVPQYPLPPPPTNWNLAISWHFEYFQFWHNTPFPPPPKKLKFSHFVALSIFSFGTLPPSP